MNVIEKTRAAVSTVGNWATAKTTAVIALATAGASSVPAHAAAVDVGAVVTDIAAQAISIHIHALAVQRSHFAQRREAALQLPAHLAVFAEQEDFHASTVAAYWVCTQSR